jgi:hypothetical protein
MRIIRELLDNKGEFRRKLAQANQILWLAFVASGATPAATLRASSTTAPLAATLLAAARLATTGFLIAFVTRLAASVSFFFVLCWHGFPSLNYAAALSPRRKNMWSYWGLRLRLRAGVTIAS